MTNGKINRKYYVLIWVALVVACFVRGAYSIYLNVTSIAEVSRLTVLISIVEILFLNGIIPAVVTFVCALIVWYIGSWRYVRCVSRNDFCYIVMAGVACVKFLVGIIEIFSILAPAVQVVTTTVLEFTLLTGVMLALFFFVLSKWYKLNPVEKYNAYKMWFIVYMVVLGLEVIGSNAVYISLADGSMLSTQILSLLAEMGYDFMSDPVVFNVQIGSSIAGICIYFAYLVLVIVLGEMLRKQSDKFRNPETRGEFYAQYDNRAYTIRNDAERVFDEESMSSREANSRDEKVFDEFDL